MTNESHDQVLIERCQELLSGSDGEGFCDIKLVHGNGISVITNKIFIFLQYPYLSDAVSSCDLGKGSF